MKRRDWAVRMALLSALVAIVAFLGWPRPLPEVRLPPEPPRRLLERAASEPSSKGRPGPEQIGEEDSIEEPVAAPSIDGLVEQLSRRELQLPMETLKPRFASCRDVEHFVGSLQVRLRIARSGAVESASVLPPNEQTATAACVRQIARTARFGRFRGTQNSVVELTYPAIFRE